MNYKEIMAVLEDKLNIEDFANGEFDENELGLGTITEVDQYGGSGKGETWYSVKHFVDHDVYIRVDGFYNSYGGTGTEFDGWDDCKEVKPKEKTITVYEGL